MADDKSDEVPIDGEEESLAETEQDDTQSQRSATSVRQGEPSQASMKQKSQVSFKENDKSQTSMQQPEEIGEAPPESTQPNTVQASIASLKQSQSEKSQKSVPPEESQASMKDTNVQPSQASVKDTNVQPSQASMKDTNVQPSQASIKNTGADPSQASINGDAEAAIESNTGQASMSSLKQSQSQKSQGPLEDGDQISLNQEEQSQISVQQVMSDLGQGAEEGDEAEAEPEPEPEPPRYIEPLGEATEETLAMNEVTPWILDKLFHEGKLGRYGMATAGQVKLEEGGLSTYEDYKWQLEKMFRQVPEDMYIGKVRLKPDELLYEEEKWVLGKLFRDLNEVEYGYMPTAENQESVIDLCEAIEVSNMPTEPPPCRPPPSMETESTMDMQGEDKACTARVMAPSGKVFEFSYAGIMAVSVDSSARVGSSSILKEVNKPSDSPVPTEASTQGLFPTGTPSQDPCLATDLNDESKLALMHSKSAVSKTCCPSAVPSKKVNVGGRPCRNNMRCDSNIKAVCDAARKAMAIYDTVTGCDNFPCNEGDRPEKEYENVEDGVWSWLYQLIFKLTPVDANQNHLVAIPEEPSNDESHLPDEM